jgi:hypothetical protein
MSVAWGAGIFPDDLATDFAAEIAHSEGLDVLQRALSQAGRARGHLLYEFAVHALIAAEALAALGGRPTAALPKELRDWVTRQTGSTIPEELWSMSRSAIERVKEDSEIAELWARSAELGRWIEKVDDLLGRLAQAGTSPA